MHACMYVCMYVYDVSLFFRKHVCMLVVLYVQSVGMLYLLFYYYKYRVSIINQNIADG